MAGGRSPLVDEEIKRPDSDIWRLGRCCGIVGWHVKNPAKFTCTMSPSQQLEKANWGRTF